VYDSGQQGIMENRSKIYGEISDDEHCTTMEHTNNY
jgi:hypothetical protein